MTRAKKQNHIQGPEAAARALEVARKRKIVTDQFYPALVAATVSVDEAKMLVSATSSLIMDTVLQTMKDRKFQEIRDSVLKKLCPDGAREKEIGEMLNIFLTENLFVTREIVEGMSNVIQQMVLDDTRNRTLNSFTPDWARMLNH